MTNLRYEISCLFPPDVADGGPAKKHHWTNDSCLLFSGYEYDVNRRHILTAKVNPCTEKIKGAEPLLLGLYHQYLSTYSPGHFPISKH